MSGPSSARQPLVRIAQLVEWDEFRWLDMGQFVLRILGAAVSVSFGGVVVAILERGDSGGVCAEGQQHDFVHPRLILRDLSGNPQKHLYLKQYIFKLLAEVFAYSKKKRGRQLKSISFHCFHVLRKAEGLPQYKQSQEYPKY